MDKTSKDYVVQEIRLYLSYDNNKKYRRVHLDSTVLFDICIIFTCSILFYPQRGYSS